MRAWVEPQFDVTPVLHDLTSTDRLESQTTDLINRLDASGTDGVLVVGHSQGGLIGRRLAQRRPDLVSGVLTVGTPHRGALLALTSRQLLADQLSALFNNLAFGCQTPQDDPGCAIAHFLSVLAADAAVPYAFSSAVPATTDLQPIDRTSNPFISNLTSTTETFRRAGIQSYARKRWVLIRQLGDWQCVPDHSTCGGRVWVEYADYAYGTFRICVIIAAVIGNEGLFVTCTFIYQSMDAIDLFWDRMTAPGDRTDAIVQGSSQIYPNALQQFEIFGGD